MDQSRRRMPGKTAPSSGHRIKLVATLALAASAAGYFALEPLNLRSAGLVGQPAGTGCTHKPYADADEAQACRPATASTNRSQGTDSGVPGTYLTGTRNSHQDDRTGKAPNDTHAPGQARSTFHDSRPGYTLAELCSHGFGDTRPRCETGRYDGDFIPAESGADAGSISGYTISGQVLTTDGDGLMGVSIVATPERLKAGRAPDAGTLRFWTVTGSSGAYSLDGLPDGEYTIRSQAHGPYQSGRITARAGVNYADLVVARHLAMVVEGQVFSSEGGPLEGVMVLPLLLGQPSVLTGNDGRYRLSVTLKPTIQSFGLRFQRPGYYERAGRAEVEYHTVSTVAAADVVMQPVESWTSVNGTVYSDSGEPLAGRTVELRPRSAPQSYRAITDRWGQYTFPAVECPADYHLIVFGGTGYKDYQEPVHVTADMGELDVVAESYEFGEVTGQLVNVDGIPVPDFDLVLRNTGSRRPNTLVSTDQFGNFEIPAAPAGELVVASQSTPSILVQGLHLQPGDRLHLSLVLDWGEHEIRGIVVDARGNPVPASQIVLQWSHHADGITTKATRRTAADTQGQFAFSNLGPGPHSLRIDAPGFSPVAINHDLSRSGYGVTVRLN